MSSWLSAHQNWYQIDNRAAGGTNWEADTYTCAHCQVQVIKNLERERPREVCFRCMRVVCDRCKRLAEAFGCQPFQQIADAVLSGTLEQHQFGLLLPHQR